MFSIASEDDHYAHYDINADVKDIEVCKRNCFKRILLARPPERRRRRSLYVSSLLGINTGLVLKAIVETLTLQKEQNDDTIQQMRSLIEQRRDSAGIAAAMVGER